jgi:cell division protein FtsA
VTRHVFGWWKPPPSIFRQTSACWLVEPQEFIIDGQDVKEPIGIKWHSPRGKSIVTARRVRPRTSSNARRCGLGGRAIDAQSAGEQLGCPSPRKTSELVWYWLALAPAPLMSPSSPRRDSPYRGDPDCRHLINSDIAMVLRTPTKDAEDIKVEHG